MLAEQRGGGWEIELVQPGPWIQVGREFRDLVSRLAPAVCGLEIVNRVWKLDELESDAWWDLLEHRLARLHRVQEDLRLFFAAHDLWDWYEFQRRSIANRLEIGTWPSLAQSYRRRGLDLRIRGRDEWWEQVRGS